MQIYFSHLTNKWVVYIEDSMRHFAMRLLFWIEEEGKKPTFVCRHWKGMAVDGRAAVLYWDPGSICRPVGTWAVGIKSSDW